MLHSRTPLTEGNAGMDLSISQLADLSGFDRRTVTKKLERLVWTEGEKGAHLYETKAALAALYVAEHEGKTFDQARTEQALASARLTTVRCETEETKRPPLDLVLGFFDAAGQEVAALLKVHKGKTLDQSRIDKIFESFRELPGKLLQGKGSTW